MKPFKETWKNNKVWELDAEPGDYRPTEIKLFHNDKWFTYVIVSLEGQNNREVKTLGDMR